MVPQLFSRGIFLRPRVISPEGSLRCRSAPEDERLAATDPEVDKAHAASAPLRVGPHTQRARSTAHADCARRSSAGSRRPGPRDSRGPVP